MICVACGLCAHVCEVAGHWKLCVVCYSCLSEGVSTLSSTMSQFEQSTNIKFVCML